MSATTREEREQWIKSGIESGATHLVVFCDSFSYEDFPVAVMPGQDVAQVQRKHLETPMTRVMEVIDLVALRAVRGKRKQAEALLGLAGPSLIVEGDRLPTDLDAEVRKL